MLFLIRTTGMTVERRQQVARHWILMRANAHWN